MQANSITIAFPYYNNPINFDLHLRAWSNLPASLAERINFIVVDDGSPDPIDSSKIPNVNIKIYRITEDLPFNFSGAKNLAVDRAQTEWILLTDIDHVINAEAATELLNLKLEDAKAVYSMGRIFPTSELEVQDPVVRAKLMIPATLLLNRRTFLTAGGYDEDFSGGYGKEDTFLRHTLINHFGCQLVHLENAKLNCYRCEYRDAPPRSRDLTRNLAIFQKKVGQPHSPGARLRFTWREIHNSQWGRQPTLAS